MMRRFKRSQMHGFLVPALEGFQAWEVFSPIDFVGCLAFVRLAWDRFAASTWAIEVVAGRRAQQDSLRSRGAAGSFAGCAFRRVEGRSWRPFGLTGASPLHGFERFLLPFQWYFKEKERRGFTAIFSVWFCPAKCPLPILFAGVWWGTRKSIDGAKMQFLSSMDKPGSYEDFRLTS